MLEKPGKDASIPKNHRPISLLSCIGKILERHLNDRLLKVMTNNNFLNLQQAGFRKGRCTQEHIFRLVQETMNGFKIRKVTVGIFLDASAAFDTVWTDALKFKLYQIGMADSLLKMLSSFLDARSIKIWINSLYSDSLELKAGTPQGSCLSPTLYLIYVNDMPLQNTRNVSPSQYADDIGIWSTAFNLKETEESLTSALKEIEKWCQKWRVILCPEKSKVVIFSRCPRHKEESINLQLFGSKLQTSEEATFLGVIFDQRLTWEPQFKKMSEKGHARINFLKAISSLSSKNNPTLLINLYKATVRSVFEYSSIAWISAAEVHLQKLQLIQNAAIRAALKVPIYIPDIVIHDASGLPRTTEYLKDFSKSHLKRIQSNSPMVAKALEDFQYVQWNKKHPSPLDVL
jgi:hypothetical protein